MTGRNEDLYKDSISIDIQLIQPKQLYLICDSMPTKINAIGEIRIKLEGDAVKNYSIDAEELGNFLLNFQSVVSKFSPVERSNFKIANKEMKSRARLYLKKIEKGSVELVFGSTPQAQLAEKNTLHDTYRDVVNTTELINKTPDKARAMLNKKFADPRRRMEVEQKIRSLFTDKLTVGLSKTAGTFVTLNHNRSEVIAEWLKEDYNETTQVIRGIILRLKGDGDKRYFTVKTDTDMTVKCYYKPELEHILSQDFKKQPIIITGLMGRKVKGFNIEEIKDLQSWKTAEIDKVGKYKFRRPLNFGVGFEEDAWFLNSEDLGTVGSGKSYQDALRDFEDNLNDTIDLYVTVHKPERMTEKAKLLRRNLQELILNIGR